MKYASVCSGIEAPSVAWHPLGWEPQWFSEIEPFPSAVLAHHYPNVPNLGDMTRIHDTDTFLQSAFDLLCGGTPCQSFSVAGLRKGLDDPRGNLMLSFLGLAYRKRPRWILWENVPGVLSSNGGRDFAAFLSGLAELGYGWAYRVLDAQYFGVAQRRRRVFVVGCLGSQPGAAAVLFERHSLQGHPAPSREAGQVAARPTGNSPAPDSRPGPQHLSASRMVAFGGYVDDGTASTPKSRDYKDATDLIAYGIDEECNVTNNGFGPLLRGGQGGTRQAVAFSIQAGALRENPDSGPGGLGVRENIAYTIEARSEVQVVAFGHQNSSRQSMSVDVISPTLDKSKTPAVAFAQNTRDEVRAMAVRRLTPVECARLQGFPDHYTNIKPNGKPTPDGPQYKAYGNSMAVPVIRWIGQRIQAVDAILNNSTP